MGQTELLEAVARLVKRQVEREVDKRLLSMRREILSEVMGMIKYSEQTLLEQVGRKSTPHRNSYTKESIPHVETPDNDFDRAMQNLKTMSAFDHITEKVVPPKRREPKFSDNPILDEILSETTGFSRDEVMGSGGVESLLDFTPHVDEPWAVDDSDVDVTDDFESFIPKTFTTSAPKSFVSENNSQPIVGTDMKPIDVTNPTVQKVLDIMANTNYKEKLDKLNEAGEQFRGGGAPAPRYNSEYFDKQVVD